MSNREELDAQAKNLGLSNGKMVLPDLRDRDARRDQRLRCAQAALTRSRSVCEALSVCVALSDRVNPQHS
jgi:hypothetical protein